MEKNILWAKFLARKYGTSVGRIKGDGSHDSAQQKDINNIERGIQGFNINWFSEKLTRHVGNEEDTIFWMDNWDMGSNMKDKYLGMYVLAEDKESMVRQVIHGNGNNQDQKIKQERTLNEDEKRLEEKILSKIQRIQLKEEERDSWSWP